jgi:hypothetical protein
MVAAITATTAAAVAPAALAVPAAPGPPGPVAFARTLAQAWADLLNYKLPGDAKIYARAMAKLSTTFSLNKPNVSILPNGPVPRLWSLVAPQTLDRSNGSPNCHGLTCTKRLPVVYRSHELCGQRHQRKDAT